jgi:hypothetical protein
MNLLPSRPPSLIFPTKQSKFYPQIEEPTDQIFIVLPRKNYHDREDFDAAIFVKN